MNNDNKEKYKLLEEVYQGIVTPKEAADYLKEYYRNKEDGMSSRSVVKYVPKWIEKKCEKVQERTFHTVLLFLSPKDMEFYHALSKQLHHVTFITVVDGDNYKKTSENQYSICSSREEDFEAVFEELDKKSLIPDCLIYYRTEKLNKEKVMKQYFSLEYLVRQQMRYQGKNETRFVYAYPFQESETSFRTDAAANAAGSMLKSVFREFPKFKVITVGLSANEDVERNAEILSGEMKLSSNDFEVLYFKSKRFVHNYLISETSWNTESKFKKDGVYLIIGGLGGIGYALTKVLAREEIKLVVVGRSALTGKKERFINELKNQKAEITYLQADVISRMEVEELVSSIKEKFSSIDGVIYCAGALKDSLLLHKKDEDAKCVLEPKIIGVNNLDYALREEKLSFFAVYSSVASVVGNRGQCDYAYANGYLDGFTNWRNHLTDTKRRYGRTIAVNWSLWESTEAGGMATDSRHEEMMEQLGIYKIPHELGTDIAKNIILGHTQQQAIIYGDQNKIIRTMEGANGYEDASGENRVLNEDVHTTAKDVIKEIFSSITKFPLDKMDDAMTFEEYGLDSVMVMNFNRAVEERFGELPKTLLYEYNTLEGLSKYLALNHSAALTRHISKKEIKEQDKNIHKLETKKTVKVESASNEKGKAYKQEDIAIIGLSGRYPGADNMEEFWKHLCEGADSVTEIPQERWNYKEYYSANPEDAKQGKIYGKWGAFLSDADKFDALFFGISPREAELMDPQERLFLETAWGAMEDAGYTRNQSREFDGENQDAQIGVFAGVTTNTYLLHGPDEWKKQNMVIPNSLEWSLANRVSYLFNLNGPSIPVDTACSSSLTAIHLACESLRNGECHMAIAGGVNLYLHPSKYLSMCQLNMLSPTGYCHTFGKDADGFVPGEGVGAVILKPLSEAEKDHDHIYGVIKGTVINHGGKTSGYTVPSPNAQADLIERALKKSHINAETINYMEAHGTGTQLGDPIEIAGLTKAYKTQTQKKGYCAVGSVKSNIGHLEGAAGIASLTKVLLQMKYKKMVPSIHCEELNPNIDFADSPFYVQKKYEDWKPLYIDGENIPRRAAISAFGAGGANAHIILEEYTKVRKSESGCEESFLIVLSAKTREQLQKYAKILADYLESNGTSAQYSVQDIAYTLYYGREHMEERLALEASSVEEIAVKLREYINGTKEEIDWVSENWKKTRQNHVLTEDEDYQFIVKSWFDKKKWLKIGKLWCEGNDMKEYISFHEEEAYRVSLPTYPFAKERYWIPVKKEKKSINSKSIKHENEEVQEQKNTLLYYQKVWEDKELTEQIPFQGNTVVVTSDMTKNEWNKKLEETLDNSKALRIIDFTFTEGKVQEEQLHFVMEHLYSMGKILCSIKTIKDVIYMIPIKGNALYETYGNAILGFMKSIMQEKGRLHFKLIRTEEETSQDKLEKLCEQESTLLDSNFEIRYVNGKRQARVLREMPVHDLKESKIVQNKTYFITGGLGALGKLFAKYLVSNYHANVVLTGRRELDASLEQELRAIGTEEMVQYKKADVSNLSELKEAVLYAERKFGKVNGVIHAAGINRDSFFIHKDYTEFSEVAKTKILGIDNLDAVFQNKEIEFMISFSSIAATIGNAGQSDYAFANGYLDGFMQKRNQMVADGRRSGRSISICWPYWKTNGMHIPEDILAVLSRKYGIRSMPPEKGLQAFETCVKMQVENPVIFYGDKHLIDKAIQGSKTATNQKTTIADKDTQLYVREKAREFLVEVFEEILHLNPDKIKDDTRFEEYGIDSITVGQFNSIAEQKLNEDSKTLLYEYQTLEELTDYLAQAHKREILELYPLKQEAVKEDITIQDIREEKIIDYGNPQDVKEEDRTSGDIAIIGLAGQYPGADNLDDFWKNLESGKDSVTEIPDDRWDWKSYYDPDINHAEKGRIYCKWGGFISDVDKFDPFVFHMSKKEADIVDPQERIFLQTVWRAIEDAGYTKESLRKTTGGKNAANVGVFAGVTTNTYLLYGPEEWKKGNMVNPSSFEWSIANRVSYIFNFRGPSIPVDTACSSSLTALHIACESLKNGECKMAVAGGVNLYLHPAKYLYLSQLRMLSPTGRCHAFGSDSDGFVPGEGVGAVILRPLEDAVKNHDHIYGIIKGSAVNHGGNTSGYTVPNPVAQAEVIEDAIKNAGITAESISYIEAHGTGTQLGDPIEIKGLTDAFTKDTQKKQFCSIGSVKSNIGHLEAAAGIASLTKVLLQMKNKKLVPSLTHSKSLSEKIAFEKTPFYLQQNCSDWDVSNERKDKKRCAGISAFGAGGANAHIIVEEYQEDGSKDLNQNQENLFLLSAQSKELLDTYVMKYIEFLHRIDKQLSMEQLCYTLQFGRTFMEERLAVIATDVQELLEKLEAYIEGDTAEGVFYGNIEDYVLTEEGSEGRNELNARRWISGEQVDFGVFYENMDIKKISLPTYPFEKISCWFQSVKEPKNQNVSAQISPILDQNISNFSEVRFAKTLSREDFYVRDHIVNGQMVLPGAAYVEMVYEAYSQASEGKLPLSVSDIYWMKPVIVEEEHEIRIRFGKQNEAVKYEVYGFKDYQAGQKEVYCSGLVETETVEENIQESFRTVIPSVMENGTYMKGNDCYPIFKEAGLNYKNSFQVIKDLWTYEEKAVSKIQLPSERENSFSEFFIHPCLLDGAFQSAMVLMSDGIHNEKVSYLPYYTRKITRYSSIPQNAIVLIYRNKEEYVDENQMCFEIEIYDEEGHLVVEIHRYTVRAWKPETAFEGEKVLRPKEDWDIASILKMLEEGKIEIEEAETLLGKIGK